MTFLVKTRHIGLQTERTWFSCETRAEADKHALVINCKAFTPYYAWVEEVGAPAPARNSFIGG